MIGRRLQSLLRANRALLVVAGFLLLWELASDIFQPPEYLLPGRRSSFSSCSLGRRSMLGTDSIR